MKPNAFENIKENVEKMADNIPKDTITKGYREYVDNLGLPHEFHELKSAECENKEGCLSPIAPVITFKSFMDLACNNAKYCLSDFFSLTAKLTDFDTDSKQGWLYTEENMALYEKSMAYFDIKDRAYYPMCDIEILINTYNCIKDVAGYLCGCFVSSDSNRVDDREANGHGTYFSNKFDELYEVLCCIKGKLVAIISAFQPDSEVVAAMDLEKLFDPGYMSYMDHILILMTDINVLLSHCTSYIFGFEEVKDVAKND